MSTPASVIDNVWYVTCKECGAYDIVGPGHPAVRESEDRPGFYELHDRDALHARLAHRDEACKTAGPNNDGRLDFSFGAAPAGLSIGKAVQ
ncbi:MAG: hypothetical protein ACYCPT_11765 [Acidimicrobiales bacterium]